VVFDDRDDDRQQLNGVVGDVKSEVEGFIAGFIDPAQPFKVGSRNVRLGSTVRFERGAEIDLANDVKVEVEGPVDAGGVITAIKVEFRQDRTAVTGPVTDYDAGARTFKVFGVTVGVDAFTESGFPALANGALVEVRGRAAGTRGITADRIRTRSPDPSNPRGEVQAVVALKGSAASPTVTLLGIECAIPAGLLLAFVDGNTTTDVGAWLAAITLNRTVVKIKGAISASSCSPEEIEIEN
jgi:hypothetical protein